MKQVHSEPSKLLASGLNNVAMACVVIGGVTPVTAMSFGVTTAPKLSLGTIAFAVIWISTPAGLHSIARRILRSLLP